MVRIAIGLCTFAVVWEVWRSLSRILNPMVVELPYFSWLPRLSAAALPVYGTLFMFAAFAFTIGLMTRWAGVILTCLSAYALLLDQQTYSNHLYLFVLILLLLTIADSGADLSVDALSSGKRRSVVAWPIWLLKIQVSLVYGFSAVVKLTPQFLSGEMLSQTLRTNGWIVFPENWRTPGLMSSLSMAAILVELFVAVGLWRRRALWAAVIVGVLLHGFILLMLESSRLSLGIFALEMFALYPLFFQRLRPIR